MYTIELKPFRDNLLYKQFHSSHLAEHLVNLKSIGKETLNIISGFNALKKNSDELVIPHQD